MAVVDQPIKSAPEKIEAISIADFREFLERNGSLKANSTEVEYAETEIIRLLREMISRGASDLHLTSNSPPMFRINGHLKPAGDLKMIGIDTFLHCMNVLTDEQRGQLVHKKELDFSFEIKDVSRFRGNIFRQRGDFSAVFRAIPHRILTFRDLALPETLLRMTDRKPGLVLVTGATGSGKSTTLAAMIDEINSTRDEHIITIEDPIEFVHSNKKSIVNQRELRADTSSFTDALKYALRQDPDVVLIGEMRDLETISAALTIAETGHLCFGTLHTNSAVQTINRIIDVFPSEQQQQIRTQLSFVLKGVIAQKLLPSVDGVSRKLALEIMIPNTSIKSLIREDKLHQIESAMLSGQTITSMMTLNQSLLDLVSRGEVSRETAILYSNDATSLETDLKVTQASGGAAFARRSTLPVT
jgi:twitching motility protein PilT